MSKIYEEYLIWVEESKELALITAQQITFIAPSQTCHLRELDLCVTMDYLIHAECLAEGASSRDFKDQLRDLQVVFEKVFDVSFKKRFPLMCCGVRRFHEANEKMNAKRCGKASVAMIHNIMKLMIVNDLPDTLCQRFDPESAECNEILSPSGTPPRGSKSKTQFGKLIATIIDNL
ncbi:hypothetical protein HNY73_020581 [Argiope bruennichi]|uniref:Uncharacterized protein n=1 Tax=Argiope bruennichi TaxID=94029 RepID=A0A8T0E749_ARGBR|nr:hypothetical protein HNY73_020581 [Argiope bruennichi]